MSDYILQQTIQRPMSMTGIGLHSGLVVNLQLLPAPDNTGIIFRRIDLSPAVDIAAHSHYVQVSALCSTLRKDHVQVSTVEHVMSALAGLAIDNLIVEINAPELPIMDGSAAPFVAAILNAGILTQTAPRKFLKIIKPIEVSIDDKSAQLLPMTDDDTAGLSMHFSIDFQHPAFLQASQTRDFNLTPTDYVDMISGARTFCFLEEVNTMRQHNLALGGSLDNAVVLDEHGVMNREGLRYDDEMLRHKMLDAIGDLYLVGYPLLGHFVAHKTGHALNNQLLQALLADKTCTTVVTRYKNVLQM